MGSINIDNTGSGSGVTLSSEDTNLVFDGLTGISTKPTPYNLTGAYYDNKSGDAGATGGYVYGFYIRPDTGTTLYVSGSSPSGYIHQGTLSSAWEIDTGSDTGNNLDASTQTTTNRDIFVSSDGSKIYVIGASEDEVFQYNMSTPYDLSTASYASKSFDVSSQMNLGDPGGLYFKSDGLTAYVTSSNYVYQYTLTSAWDASTASYANKSAHAGQNGTTGVTFSENGTNMYTVGSSSDTVMQHTLSTPWDVSTASNDYIGMLTTSNNPTPRALSFKPDGSILYVGDSNYSTIYQYVSLVSPKITVNDKDIVNSSVVASNAQNAPEATGANSTAIGSGAQANQRDGVAIGTSARIGNAYSLALGYCACVSGGEGGTAAGRCSRSSGGDATAIGKSYASGSHSIATNINNNTSSYGATGSNSIAIGYQAKATSSYSISIGWGNTAGNRSVVVGGQGSCAHDNAVAIGTWQSDVREAYSAAIGGGNAHDHNVQNRWMYSVFSSPGLGKAQAGKFVLYLQTTDATEAGMKTNGSPVGSNNQIKLGDDHMTWGLQGQIIAREASTTNQEYAVWEIKGVASRDNGVATTTVDLFIKNKLYCTANATSWDIDIVPDTTNGAARINVTGEASTTIRWIANIDTTEIGV